MSSPALITQLQRMDATDRTLAQSIFGYAEPEQISAQVVNLCRSQFNQEITACLFWEVSVSFTIGVQLERGDRAVIKFRSPANMTLEMLQAVCWVQQALAEQGFPAPPLRLLPMQQQDYFVSIEEFLDIGENGNAHGPEVRQAMATGLAQLIQLVQSLAAPSGFPLSRFRSSALWEKPHNVLFDFEGTAAGAEWIDEIADRAKTQFLEDTSPLILGHMDWSVKNMRIAHGKLSAVYDWDSLRLENERVILGNALKGFLVTWYVDAGAIVPTPAEVADFLQIYESMRSAPFTTTDRQTIFAAFLYSMAYTARCEHAIDPIGTQFSGSFREALQNYRSYQACFLSV